MSIAVISLSTALNVFTLNVHHKGLRGHKVPHCLKRVFFGIVSKMLFLKIDLPVAPEEGMVNTLTKIKGFFYYIPLHTPAVKRITSLLYQGWCYF